MLGRFFPTAREVHLLDLVGGSWLAEQKALHLRAALEFDRIELMLRFHALGSGHHAEAFGQSSHRPHDVERARALDVLDEGAIDLDAVEWEALQMAERGITGAEVVQSDADAQ